MNIKENNVNNVNINKIDYAREDLKKEVNKIEINTENKSIKDVNVSISKEALNKLSEERTVPFNRDKVEDLKIKIQNGTYEFDSKKTAANLMGFEK